MRKHILLISILSLMLNLVNAQIKIKMNYDNGVYTTPCVVNGLKLSFIFDTGASNVSISLTEAYFMLKNGYLDNDDLQGSSYVQIANGDIIENTSVLLKTIEIADIKIYNVRATIVHNLEAPLLLGQSAIQKLGKIQLDGNELIITKNTNIVTLPNFKDCEQVLVEAHNYFNNNLMNVAIEKFEEAYDICSSMFNGTDFMCYGIAYFFTNKFYNAIKYLELASLRDNMTKNDLFYIYLMLSKSYVGINSLENAKTSVEKSLIYSTTSKDSSRSYSQIAFISAELNDNYNAINYYKASIEFYLKHIGKTKEEVMMGQVNNSVLGEQYWNLALCYKRQNLMYRYKESIIKSALCGEELSIQKCYDFNWNYNEK